jgi:hypothetical protein
VHQQLDAMDPTIVVKRKFPGQTFMALTGRPWMDETLGAAR